MSRKETGDLGEKLARDYLKKKGYRVLETNYNCPHGEIDIISRKKDVLVFTEVRAKTGTGFGTPEESVTGVKKGRIRASALHYLQTHKDMPESWRIDFIGVELTPEGKVSRIELIENAVGGE